MKLLVVSRAIHWDRDEGSEIREQIAGMVEADPRGDLLEIRLTDCVHVYEPSLVDGELRLRRTGGFIRSLLSGADVVHVHLLIPHVHLFVAILFRLRGSVVVFSPMTFLGQDFAGQSWTRQRSKVWQRLKPRLVSVLRSLWLRVAHYFMCLSEEDIRVSKLPVDRCIVAPWPKPASDLMTAYGRLAPATRGGNADALSGIAFASRFDPYRKGIDRMVSWVARHKSNLPRPAVMLFVPQGRPTPPGLDALCDQGFIEWNQDAYGEQLLPYLIASRGVMLLSRFEGQPRILREAACLGLPTLSTRSCHFAEVVDLLDMGAVVDGDDDEAVQAAFERFAQVQRSSTRANEIFDRASIGDFLVNRVVEAANGDVGEMNYYRYMKRQNDSSMSGSNVGD